MTTKSDNTGQDLKIRSQRNRRARFSHRASTLDRVVVGEQVQSGAYASATIAASIAIAITMTGWIGGR